MMWFVYWDIEHDELSFHLPGARGDFDRPTEWHYDLLRAYSKLDGAMGRREILPNEDGVLYTAEDGASQILWAFEPLTLPLPAGALVEDALTGENIDADVLKAGKRRIYRITLPAGAQPISMR